MEGRPRHPQQVRLCHPRRIAQHTRPSARRWRKATSRHLSESRNARKEEMKLIVAAVIERSDRRILIGQRRREDTSPLEWEFPGGKVEEGETPEAALARELQEELNVTLEKCAEMARARYKYPSMSEELEIR